MRTRPAFDMPEPTEVLLTRPQPPKVNWKWYSFCSKHQEYAQTCANCNSGRWISDEETEFNNWLWTYSPRVWRAWANRNNVSGWRQWLRDHKWSKTK